MVTISASELEELRKLKKNMSKSKPNLQERTSTSANNVSNLVHSDTGMKTHALMSMNDSVSSWILDSGASRHVTGMSSEFTSYSPYPYYHKETVQTADGTSQPIKGVGTVQCTPSITLSSVYMFLPSQLIWFQ